MSRKRSEASFVLHNIVPSFAQYGYPQAGDSENMKVAGDIRMQLGSDYGYPDLVYYASGIPLIVIENKRPKESMERAVGQAFSYTKLFPVDEYSTDGVRPLFFGTTDGPHIHKTYKYIYEIDDRGILIEDKKELPSVPTYEQLQHEYGIKAEKPELTPELFKEVFYDLAATYIRGDDKSLLPKVIKNVVLQIYEFLHDQENYVSRQPYTSLDGHHDRQLNIRNLLSRYDWQNSLGPDIAHQFHQQINRSFQGASLNQYITPQPVVDFMSNLVKISSEDRVLDFECGSGSYLRTAVNAGAVMENVFGVDIADLPYYVAKTYLALYFGRVGEDTETIPIIRGNGLLDNGNNWDVVISNPAGGSKYNDEELHDLSQVYEYLDNDINNDGNPDRLVPSEYYLSIQKAVKAAKVGGRICLVLPEGFFSNSSDEVLRKYVAKYCDIKAIISLSRGIFSKGTTTRTVNSGSQQSSQKFSIFYCVKKSHVVSTEGVELNDAEINYPVFIASIEDKDRLEESLEFILKQYQHWEANNTLNQEEKIPKKNSN